jgi:UDP-N-acetylmuramyl pentapeptide phosphotransferase/UDP-N-acetylglucosamine-1-phosphate transferase
MAPTRDNEEVVLMSAFLYGRIENNREAADPNLSTNEQPPGLKTYADAFVALVPAEVLAAGIFFVDQFSETKKDDQGKDVVTVTDASSLKWAFYGCIVLAAFLYILGHIKGGTETNRWDRWDFLRMLIPAGAFVGWAMAVQPATMFDNAINISDGHKILLVVFGGILAAALATVLGMKADAQNSGGGGGGGGGG